MNTSRVTRRRFIRVVAALAATASLAACSSSSESADTTAAPAEPALKIVSLSPTATEMIYAIGAGDQVVAVDSLSTYPDEVAPKVTKISAYEPSAEAILEYEPDVVLISNDMNKITEQLTAAKPDIKVWTGAAASNLEGVYDQITQLGELTGRVDAAAELVSSMKNRIEAATSGVTAPAGTSYFYELDNTLYSVTSNTFVGALLSPFGLTNIADGVQEGNDYPQLSAEVIVDKDPTIIFLADTKCCGTSATEVASRAGWENLSAVKSGNVVELDDDIASRWGPRVADLVEAFAAAVKALNK